MGRYKFGIVSYHRPDKQFMMSYLHDLGYQKEDIIIHTEEVGDYEVYKRLFGDKATILYKRGNNVCDNKNNLLEWYNENSGEDDRLIICSDKVKSVMYLGRDGKLHKMDRDTLDSFLNKAFYVSKQYGASLFGPYTVKNPFFMSHSTHINQFLLGCFMGIVNPKETWFDPRVPLKEDWNIVLRTISSGGSVMRFNDIALEATFRTKGGSYELWHNGETNRICTRILLESFPHLVKPHQSRENELKYIGPTQRIERSILS